MLTTLETILLSLLSALISANITSFFIKLYFLRKDIHNGN